MSLLTTADRMEFFVRGERFATYRNGTDAPGFTAIYAPDNRVLTRSNRADGLALWLQHGDVNGIAFGTEIKKTEAESSGLAAEMAARRARDEDNTGRIVIEETLARRGSESVGFQQTCWWTAPDEQIVLNETRTIRVAPGPSEGGILDVSLLFKASKDAPVRFGVSPDSFLRMQVVSTLRSGSSGQLRNALGEYGFAAMHGRAAAWCGGVGVVDGQTVGFVWLDHPANPWHPCPWIVREDGALSPSPFAWRSVELAPRETLVLRYRLLVHTGYVEQDWADARLRDWLRE